MVAEEVVDVAELFGYEVELAGEVLDLRFGAAVYVEVQLAADAVFLVLTVLAHHDDRGLDGGEHGQEEVEQDEGIRVPRPASQGNVDAGVDDQHDCEEGDEGPGAAEAGDGVGDVFAKGEFLFDDFVGIAGGAQPYELVGGVELMAED